MKPACKHCYDDGFIREGRNVFSCSCVTNGTLKTTKELPVAKKKSEVKNPTYEELSNLDKQVKELESMLKAAEADSANLRERLLQQSQLSLLAFDGLEMLGLPGVKDPNFEAKVVHTAYKLGLLKRTPIADSPKK